LSRAFFGGAFLGCLTFALELCGAFFFLSDAFFGVAVPFLAGAFFGGCAFALLPGGTPLSGAALIPSPSVPSGWVLSLRSANRFCLYLVPWLYGAIGLQAVDFRAGNGPRCGQAR
jgi:hypothetical protein